MWGDFITIIIIAADSVYLELLTLHCTFARQTTKLLSNMVQHFRLCYYRHSKWLCGVPRISASLKFCTMQWHTVLNSAKDSGFVYGVHWIKFDRWFSPYHFMHTFKKNSPENAYYRIPVQMFMRVLNALYKSGYGNSISKRNLGRTT